MEAKILRESHVRSEPQETRQPHRKANRQMRVDATSPTHSPMGELVLRSLSAVSGAPRQVTVRGCTVLEGGASDTAT
jgi:hypothetical protein